MSIVKHRTMDIVLFIILIPGRHLPRPLLIVLMNSFRASSSSLPTLQDHRRDLHRRENCIEGARKIKFSTPSATITVFPHGISGHQHARVNLARVKSVFTTHYLLVFSMIVPFQMVMFTMSKTANSPPETRSESRPHVGRRRARHLHVQRLHQDHSQPEEAAMIDGATAPRPSFRRLSDAEVGGHHSGDPNACGCGTTTQPYRPSAWYKTIRAIQYLRGLCAVDMAMMAMSSSR